MCTYELHNRPKGTEIGYGVGHRNSASKQAGRLCFLNAI